MDICVSSKTIYELVTEMQSCQSVSHRIRLHNLHCGWRTAFKLEYNAGNRPEKTGAELPLNHINLLHMCLLCSQSVSQSFVSIETF